MGRGTGGVGTPNGRCERAVPRAVTTTLALPAAPGISDMLETPSPVAALFLNLKVLPLPIQHGFVPHMSPAGTDARKSRGELACERSKMHRVSPVLLTGSPKSVSAVAEPAAHFHMTRSP